MFSRNSCVRSKLKTFTVARISSSNSDIFPTDCSLYRKLEFFLHFPKYHPFRQMREMVQWIHVTQEQSHRPLKKFLIRPIERTEGGG